MKNKLLNVNKAPLKDKLMALLIAVAGRGNREKEGDVPTEIYTLH